MSALEASEIANGIEKDDTADMDSLGSLNVSLRDTNDENEDTSLNLNDDLASFSGRSNSILSGGALSRRSFESSSIFTSSFRPSFDDSLPSLGHNKLSIQTVSPLGPNSIYELIADVDTRRHKNGSSLSPYPQKHQQRSKLNISPPTQNDIPLIQLTKLEKVPKDKLQKYLKDISKEYEKHHFSKKINLSNLRKLSSTNNEKEDVSAVPTIFFNSDFNLDDPRVFKAVTENADLSNIDDLLQDKLSTYLDIIEVNLVDEISKTSGSFFDALNDLDDINGKNLETIESIRNLKIKLEDLKKNKIDHNLKRIALQNKRDNVARLEQGLLQINNILKETEVANSLFLQSEYDACLQKIELIEDMLKGEDSTNDLTRQWPYKLQDLSHYEVLKPIQAKLARLRASTGQSISKLFISFLLSDLRKHYEDINFETTLERLTNNGNYKRDVDPEFRKQLNSYISDLAKSGELSSSFKSYQSHVITEIKNIVRVFLPSEQENDQTVKESSVSSSTINQNNNAGKSLSVLIKSMTPREFEDMLAKIFATVSEGLRRLTVHQKLLLDLTLNRDDINPNLIPDLDIRECIHKSIEIIQIRLGKIIAVRKDVTSSLRLDYFLRFFYILSVFLNECESISGLNFKFLPDVLNQQIKNFNGTLQNNNLKKVSRSIETEEWKPLIVSKHLQLIVNNIVGNENLDFGNDWKTGLLHLRQRDQDQSKEEEEENSHKRSIVVGDKTFVANNSLLELISLTKTIFILKSNFNHLSGLYESNIIELYKYYNGRTMQSIKNSDNSLNKEKNLSVVGESLDCIAELIHYIRADFNNPDYDDAYSNLLAIISSSKSKIDSINTIPE